MIYAGITQALELARTGQPHAPQRRNGPLYSLAPHLCGASPVEPMYVGIGQGNGRTVNAYLLIGTPWRVGGKPLFGRCWQPRASVALQKAQDSRSK